MNKPKTLDEKVPAENLAAVAFPDCASRCLAVEYLGVGECEAVCPGKFVVDGNSKPPEDE
jgi:hypothetical protein